MVKSILGPGIDTQAARTFRQNDRAASDRPKRPSALPRFATTAALPPAATYPGCLAFKVDAGIPVISDGTFWYPITLGAHL